MTYGVKFSVPYTPLKKSDISFVVQTEDEVFGILKVSKGALVWVPRHKKTGHKIDWQQFDDLARSFPSKEAKKSPKRATKKKVGSA